MKLLLDTHILLWAAGEPERLPETASSLIEDQSNTLYFSSASIWEIVIKNALGRPDFAVNVRALLKGLRSNGYEELAVTSSHAVAVDGLPPFHKDPFDRLLIAQAYTGNLTLLSNDSIMKHYTGYPIWCV